MTKAKRPTVKEMMAQKKKGTDWAFTADQLKEIKTAISINDGGAQGTDRVSVEFLAQHLREHYGFKLGRTAMERKIREVFKRRSWAQP